MRGMQYRELLPEKDLQPFVGCFWEYDSGTESREHTILPNGCFELFFIITGGRLESVLLSGLRTRPFQVEVPAGVTVFSVRLLLLASEYLLRSPISHILNDSKEWKDFPHEFHRLAAMPFEEKAAFLSLLFTETFGASCPEASKMRLMTSAYWPNQSVAGIAAYTGCSQRTIRRYFSNQFGLSLKLFLEIMRFRSAFSAIRDGELWPDNGCYDQSHFIKEVRKFSDESPKNLHKNEDGRFLQFSVCKKE